MDSGYDRRAAATAISMILTVVRINAYQTGWFNFITISSLRAKALDSKAIENVPHSNKDEEHFSMSKPSDENDIFTRADAPQAFSPKSIDLV